MMVASSTRRRNGTFSRGRRWARPIDQSTTAQAVRQPGIDPRQWVSLGLVTAGGEEDDIVVFDEEEGQPLVRVLLEPSKTPVVARVAAQIAGNGEGEWHPFVEGDEVVVLIPEGNERAGCIIVGRLSNSIDAFPMESVAGQDPTTNTFGFRRRNTPFVEEFNGPIIMRTATSGALLSIDTGGTFTVRTGDRSVLQMSPDVIGFQGPSNESSSPELLMQLDIPEKRFSLNVGDAVLNLNDSGADPATNTLKVGDSLSIHTSGNFAAEHAMSVENFINILVGFLPVINPSEFPDPAMADMKLATAITAATSSGPWTSAPQSQTALIGALQAQPDKPLALPTGLQAIPGVASQGLMIG